VVINSYEIEQDLELFMPDSPPIMQPLDRNWLYPFYVYGNDEEYFYSYST
jgi:hypothetical protein